MQYGTRQVGITKSMTAGKMLNQRTVLARALCDSGDAMTERARAGQPSHGIPLKRPAVR
jgi:hypothetical protein